ncbi:hypothetical protein SDRG_15862, partial [Saprolegnia diclina VS20]
LERPFLVFASSVVGAIATVWGIGFFAGGYPNAGNLKATVSAGGDWVYDIPSSWWYYLAATIVLCGLGIFFQFKEFNKDRMLRQDGAYAAAATPRRGDPIRHV